MSTMAPDIAPARPQGTSLGRIQAMVLRHVYLLRSSWPRVVELIYWPTLEMVIWGFMSQFMRNQGGYLGQAFGVLLGAVLLWDVFFRGQLGILVSFLEEYWARNLGHLFVSPLRPAEWVGSLIVMSIIRVLVGTLPAALLAIPFFGYSIFDMGLPLILFFVLLTLLGWAIGLMIIAVVMVNGLGAESLAWLAVFLLSPISAVYYPVSVLPVWLQYVAWGLPTSHVFEGMRTLVLSGRVDWAEARTAFLLDLVYIALGALAFLTAFRAARREGKLLGLGE